MVEAVYAMRSPVQYVPSPLPMNEIKTPGGYGSNASPMYQGHFNFANTNNMRNTREEPMQTDIYLQGKMMLHGLESIRKNCAFLGALSSPIMATDNT